MSKKCVGIDIGGTTVKLGIFEESGVLVENGRFPPARRTAAPIFWEILRSP